jgi:photosystem II stability/assembly factor-like uncharacterized protein
MYARSPFALLTLAAALSCASPPPADSDPALEWSLVPLDVEGSFRGLDAAGGGAVWASGTGGTVLRSVDAGETWSAFAVPGAEELDFRDVEAFGRDEALVVSAGRPARFYLTTDAGATWTLTREDDREGIFLDAMSFWDRQHGIVFGDPIDGRFVVLVTEDGGRTWNAVPDDALPPALEGEAGFAASGSCLATYGDRHVWFGTGGAAARVFRSDDRGRTWSVAPTPIVAGADSKGIFSLAFVDERRGVAVGGDYGDPERLGPHVAVTDDGGATWRVPGAIQVGFRSAVRYLDADGDRLVAVGSHGSDVSSDGGASWTSLGPQGFHALAVPPDTGAGPVAWAIGAGGSVGRLVSR